MEMRKQIERGYGGECGDESRKKSNRQLQV
jgi:hypothetical protein